MNKIAAALLAGLAVAVSGCAQSGGRTPVVVLDLSRVATETGQDVIIREEADATRGELMAQLQQLAGQLEQQLATEREKAGESPSEEDAQRLQQLTMQAQQQIGVAQQQAQQQASMIETTLVTEFRDKVEPIAEKIARERGATAVLAADAYMYWSDPTIDITAEVIEAYKALPGQEAEDAAAAAEAEAAIEQAGEDLAESTRELVESTSELVEAETDAAADKPAE